MRIVDKDGKTIVNPDLAKGRLEEDKLFVAHHEAVPEVPEVSHYAVAATYPNGGRDLEKVTDTPYTPAVEAWDEYEQVQRYIPYTPEELENINKPTADEDRDAMLVDMAYRLTVLELGL